jgi:hypothetical protein
MPVTDVQLVSGGQVPLVFLWRLSQGSSALTYLRSVKSGVMEVEGTFLEQSYRSNVGQFAKGLASEVAALQPFDALLVPPTGRPDLVEPYAVAIRAKLTGTSDLSRIIHRDPGASSGKAASYEQIRCALHLCDPVHELSSVRRLLVIDDVYARGFTASAIHELFATAGGFRGELVVACPLVADRFCAPPPPP